MTETLTADQREYARITTIITGLKMDIRGIKPTRGFSGVTLAREYGYTGRSKQGALDYLERYRHAMVDTLSE